MRHLNMTSVLIRVTYAWLVCTQAAACGGSFSPTRSYPSPAPIMLPVPPDSVWPSIVDVVTANSLIIKTIDRSSGFLQTEVMRGANVEWWDCGEIRETSSTTGGASYGRTVPIIAEVFTTITIAATPVQQGTSIRVMTTPHAHSITGSLCASKGTFETALLGSITKKWNHDR